MDQPQPNTWAFFGGGFEEGVDQTPKDTAKREFTEESGRNDLKYQISSEPFYVNDDNFLRFYSYIGIFNEEFVPDLTKEDESQDYGWFYFSELPDNLLPGVQESFGEKGDVIMKLINKFFNNGN